MSVCRPRRRMLCAALSGVLAGSPVVLVTTAGPALAATVSVPATPVAGSTVGPLVPVAATTFAGGRRLVVATVAARRAPGARSTYFMFAATLTCGTEAITSTTNVAASGTLTPRRIMTDARACTVAVRSSLGTGSADRLLVSATFTATPVTFGGSTHVATGHPTLLEPGKAYDAVAAVHTLTPGMSFLRLAGDLKVTTCTTVGGSRENGSGNLCEGRVNTSGSQVRIALVAQQLGASGGFCAVLTVAERTMHVNKNVHHATIFQDGVYPMIRGNPACLSQVRTKIYVKAVSGADLVVHRGGTILSTYR